MKHPITKEGFINNALTSRTTTFVVLGSDDHLSCTHELYRYQSSSRKPLFIQWFGKHLNDGSCLRLAATGTFK